MKETMKCLFIILVFASNLNIASAQGGDSYYTDLTRLSWNNIYNNSSVKKAKEVMQCNEFESNEAGQASNIFANPLLINGQLLDYGNFDLNSKGLLTVVKGNPETDEAMPIPFQVYIRREGKVVEDKKMSFLNKTLLRIELSDIFSCCKNGDLLIIKPMRSEDWKAKRVLKLIGPGC